MCYEGCFGNSFDRYDLPWEHYDAFRQSTSTSQVDFKG